MTPFRCTGIPTEVADRFRSTARDDFGNAVRRFPGDETGLPCRHCLAESAGQAAVLGSYRMARPQGIYWTPSPIFVHADSCPRYERRDEIPDIVRPRLVSLRAYDADQQVIYGLGDVAEGRDCDGLLERCLADARTAFVNIHTARPGCFLCTVERV